jgi:ribosomal protein L40E
VGPELSAAPHAAACPACGAALRPEALWCSLCYHDLRPAPAPTPATPTPGYDGLDPLTAPLLDLVLPPVPAPEQPVVVETPAPAPVAPAPRAAADAASWPCTRCGAPNAIDAPVCGTCGSPFLAAAAEKVSLVVPGLGDLSHFTRGQRAGIALGVLMAVLLPLALITFLLTPAPKTGDTGKTETTVTNVAP